MPNSKSPSHSFSLSFTIIYKLFRVTIYWYVVIVITLVCSGRSFRAPICNKTNYQIRNNMEIILAKINKKITFNGLPIPRIYCNNILLRIKIMSLTRIRLNQYYVVIAKVCEWIHLLLSIKLISQGYYLSFYVGFFYDIKCFLRYNDHFWISIIF